MIHELKKHSMNCNKTSSRPQRNTSPTRPLASLDPPGGRVRSLSPWESRPERPERVCITRVVFNLPLALSQLSSQRWLPVKRFVCECGYDITVRLIAGLLQELPGWWGCGRGPSEIRLLLDPFRLWRQELDPNRRAARALLGSTNSLL